MFKLYRSNGRPNGSDIDYKPAKAGVTYSDGDALVFTGGALEKATGTTAPTHISAAEYAAPAANPDALAVYPVLPGMWFKTTFAADASAVAEGSRVTIHTDAAQVTATTASGVATIQRKTGDGMAGTGVLVSF